MTARLEMLYPEHPSENLYNRLEALIKECDAEAGCAGWNQSDVILITYGNSVTEKGSAPLSTLHRFLADHLKETLSIVHILPFFPYSSDDGFSVIDYTQVNPDLGTWEDINRIAGRFHLMADLVINHISQKSEWFQNFLNGKDPGKDYFITEDPEKDLSATVRPRSSPLLSEYETKDGLQHVWTTFSRDQVDLNFKNPDVLLEMIKVFLLYLQKGTRIIRLDAIAFMWKEPGTTCLHLPQVHEAVKLFRDVASHVNPGAVLLTETNVPHEENISYFGEGDEAQMVYQFPLPPLLLYTLCSGSSRLLTQWAAALPEPPKGCTFFNFTASHDGIGLRPLEGILPDDQKERFLEHVKQMGGRISMREKPDGSQCPYEMNVSYFDACKQTFGGPDELQVRRFLCSQTIMMSLQGIPAFYIHSLLATPNDYEGMERTGQNRSINRKSWDKNEVEKLLESSTFHQQVFNELRRLIQVRRKQSAFHPDAAQEVIDLGEFFFILKRENRESGQVLHSISNITNKEEKISLENVIDGNGGVLTDLISGKEYDADEALLLKPYQTAWMTVKK